MLFRFLARKISLGCFRLEAGAGLRRGRERGAEHGSVGTEMPPQTPRAAGAESWLIAALPAQDHPGFVLLPPSGSRCAQCKLGGMRRVPPGPDPWGGRQARAVPVLGCFPACCWVTAQPTHTSIRKTLTGLLNCLSAAGCRSRQCCASDGPAKLSLGLPGASSP